MSIIHFGRHLTNNEIKSIEKSLVLLGCKYFHNGELEMTNEIKLEYRGVVKYYFDLYKLYL